MLRIFYSTIPKTLLIVLAGSYTYTTLAATSPDLTIENAWARAMPPSAKVSAVYLTIKNRGDKENNLIGASCNCAKTVELHNVENRLGAMTMFPVKEIPIPGQGSAELTPGGYHVMLIDLKAPLVADKKIELHLKFQRGEEYAITVPILPGSEGEGMGEHHHTH